MKDVLLFMLVSFVLSGCAHQKVYKKYPDCTDYFNYVKKSWNKKDNGFFVIAEIPDSTKSIWAKYVERPQFKQQWDKYSGKCLCKLTEKEVRTIFGEPIKKGETYNVNDKITTNSYSYLIADESCDEGAQEKSQLVICSSILTRTNSPAISAAVLLKIGIPIGI